MKKITEDLSELADFQHILNMNTLRLTRKELRELNRITESELYRRTGMRPETICKNAPLQLKIELEGVKAGDIIAGEFDLFEYGNEEVFEIKSVIIDGKRHVGDLDRIHSDYNEENGQYQVRKTDRVLKDYDQETFETISNLLMSVFVVYLFVLANKDEFMGIENDEKYRKNPHRIKRFSALYKKLIAAF